jgi:hypothetical protein
VLFSNLHTIIVSYIAELELSMELEEPHTQQQTVQHQNLPARSGPSEYTSPCDQCGKLLNAEAMVMHMAQHLNEQSRPNRPDAEEPGKQCSVIVFLFNE